MTFLNSSITLPADDKSEETFRKKAQDKDLPPIKMKSG